MSRACIVIAILLLLSGCAHSDQWTRRDTVLQLAVNTVMLADALSTARIRETEYVSEVGPLAKQFLGAQPETDKVVQYFVTVAIASYLISRALPEKWRPYWQGWELAIHSYSVGRNCANGLC